MPRPLALSYSRVSQCFESGIFARAYTRGDSWVGLGVGLALDEARLTFWFENKDGEDRAAGLLSQDDWDPDLDDNYGYWSRKGLARIEEGCVPLERLHPGSVGALATAITG